MASGSSGAINNDLGRAYRDGPVAGLTEGELLGRFADRRDEVAFEALIARHGPMVLGVCRRMLGDPHAAADAFQATFLVLVRRASTLRDADRLGPWLHGVACRVAAKARADAARRRDREARGAGPGPRDEATPLERAELRGALDEELNRLPERYRRPIVLCDLEGATHAEAARRLRCTTGMLRGRLDRGRAKLRARLGRRGLAPSAPWMIAAPPAAPVPRTLVEATALAAIRLPTGGAASASAWSALGSSRSARAALLGRSLLAASILALAGGFLLRTPPGPGPDAGPRPAGGAPTVGRAEGLGLLGRVLDTEGRPIPGARVARESSPPAGPTRAATTTDAEGRFEFAEVAPGPSTLTVQAAGHAPDLREIEVAPGRPPVEFRLGPGRSIRGRVVDLAGRPIAGAPIGVGPWRGHNTLAWQAATDADGRYRWDDAPGDEVLIDLGALGFTSKRFLSYPPGTTEREMTMPRPRFVRGSVTDATTGRPIERFTVLTGHGDAAGTYLEWEYAQAIPGSGGAYEAKLDAAYRSFDRFVRVEADGYIPERSRALPDGEAEWDRAVDFRLRPGDSAIAGIVRRADGSPLPGAEVALVTTMTVIADGRFADHGSGRRATTGPDGRFRFPALDTAASVVVLHEAGYAERTAADLAKDSELTIRPWGRVEGTYRVGPKPGTGEVLTLTRIRPDPFKSLIQFNGSAPVDAEGRFAFGRVRDGAVAVAIRVPQGRFATAYPVTEPLTIEPGATARVAIGGTGRPVVGRLDLPASIADRADWSWSEILLSADRPPRRTLVGKHMADGGFRFEDVPAGPHTLMVEIKKTPADSGPGFADRPIAEIRRRVEVPAMPGGRSDEPLDLGRVAPPGP